MNQNQIADIRVPPRLAKVFIPERGDLRYRGAYGGRGSGKSRTFGEMSAVFGYREPLRILCTRELQKSIKESFYAEVKGAIESSWLRYHYEIGDSFIRGKNDTEYLFAGLRHNMSAIKSMSRVDICIVEEAEDVPESSWIDLIPTIRAMKSEIWVIWNPRLDGSPTDKRFKKNPPPSSCIVEVNYQDNPWFPAVLEQERLRDKDLLDDDTYQHVWHGRYLNHTDANVLKGRWSVEPFTVEAGWDGPYYGADWGFSTDPAALIKFWISGRDLFIEKEYFGNGIEIVDLPAAFLTIEGSDKHIVRADNARPEIISHMQKNGFPKLSAAPKWPGSIEDGISWLRGYNIIIHPDCPKIAQEARLWSYKVDRNTGEVLPVLVDKFNHGWDAVRYGASPMIRKAKGGVFMDKPIQFEPFRHYTMLSGQWVYGDTGELKVWEEPGGDYIVGAVLRHSGAGVSSIQVIDHHRGTQVAAWYSDDGDINNFVAVLGSLCRRYSGAWAVIDNSGQGPVVIQNLMKSYKRIYSEVPVEAKTGNIGKQRRFGFDGVRGMPALIERLVLDPSGLQDIETITELDSFARDDEDNIVVVPGYGHERVLAYCLARHGQSVLPRPRRSQAGAVLGTTPGANNKKPTGRGAWKKGFV